MVRAPGHLDPGARADSAMRADGEPARPGLAQLRLRAPLCAAGGGDPRRAGPRRARPRRRAGVGGMSALDPTPPEGAPVLVAKVSANGRRPTREETVCADERRAKMERLRAEGL